MIHYKTLQDIERIRESALLVSETLGAVAGVLKPGVTTLYLDGFIEEYIVSRGGIPGFKNYRGFPFSACISVNDVVVHGFPNEGVLKEGDVVSIDVGVLKGGFYGDSAYTFVLGGAELERKELVLRTKASLLLGIEEVRVGRRIGDVSFAIQEATEGRFGYGVVRDLVGHGLGRRLHEDPSVPNYGRRGYGVQIKEGLVIAIEPMINLGTREVFVDEDGWTIRTKDGRCSAHFEHTVAVVGGVGEVLSDFGVIERAIGGNGFLWNEVV